MPYPAFDRRRLILEPLAARAHDLTLSSVMELAPPREPAPERIVWLANRIRLARDQGASRILIMGAHVIRRGNARYLIDLLERGWLTHIALNGAGAIHDLEFAMIGATTESVARYIRDGRFGMWTETGRINDIAVAAAADGIGLGEAVGRSIHEGGPAYPHGMISVLAAAYRLGVPATVHVSLGQDIVHQHPNCDGAAVGAATYTDFLVFANAVTHLEHGAVICAGSAVMGPEVYLKALSMARNVARQEGRQIADFTTAVFDLPELGEDFAAEPARTDPRYYYRPWKTILVRTVADGGASAYVQGDHRDTIPALWNCLAGGAN